MKGRSAQPTPTGDLLGDIKLPRNVLEHLKNREIWSKWGQIVGSDLARVTAPHSIKAKTLNVTVVHQAWAHQLQFLTPSILNKLRGLCPDAEIRDLHFRIGEVETTEPQWAPSKETKPVRLSERMEMTLRAVEDDDLRSSIRKAMEASVKRDRTQC